jgi:RHS repeat-associated protein
VYSGSSPIRGSGVGVVAKRYEISNHLGNVLTTFTDQKKELQNANTVTGYAAIIKSSQDYYPFGMIMNGRNYNTSEYRFGFNGQEKTDEVSGVGNHLDFKYRGYDSKTGRFWSVDPLFKDYTWNSTYCFAENDVIRAKDLEGLEKLIVNNPNAFDNAMYFYKVISSDDILLKILYKDISKPELKDKVYIYFGVAYMQEAYGISYSEESLTGAAERGNGYDNYIFQTLGITKEIFLERKKQGIKQCAVIIDEGNPSKSKVKTIAHEINLHLKNIIKGKKVTNKSYREEHKKGYEPYYKNNPSVDPKYTPDDSEVPSNSEQGKIEINHYGLEIHSFKNKVKNEIFYILF